MKKNVMFAIATILLPALVAAQFSISGKIIDRQNEQALAGATITSGNYIVQSNFAGEYSIPNLKAGKYLVKVTYLGYQPFLQTIVLNSNETINAALERNGIVTDEVLVNSTRANKNSATTYRNVGREELEKNNLGQDLPYLLNQTPSVVVSSDAGTGIGYTGIRIRGSDPTRINVTLNGIPYNDSESQGLFWVNMPDFASSVDNIQVQRGVGTSTNGAGAFGGSLNVQTTTLRDSAYAELNNTAGSFGTLKNTVMVGTGLINGKFTFDGRLSRIISDGYIDRGASKLRSYFLSGAYYGKKDLLRANVFSGAEKTFQVWNGIPEAKLTGDNAALLNHYYNNLGYLYHTTADSINLFDSDKRKYSQFLYDDQTDNYSQDHYQLLYTHTFSPQLNINTALHYTYGRGYFEEYKNSQSLDDYELSSITIGGTTINETDLIRRRWLDNDFYGFTYSLNYNPSEPLSLTLGGAYNEYDGDHFGEVIWAQYASDSKIRQRYYNGNGFKTDFNIYGRTNYQVGKINLFADLQYRGIGYKITGTDKNRNQLNHDIDFNFFNPKIGLTYQLNPGSNFYASFAIANKEPNRDDFINSSAVNIPKSENLKDLEAGYRVNGKSYSAGINAYAMFYNDQLVLTGKINDVGEYIRQNVSDSYRMGLELDSRVQIIPALSWSATAALSRNKVKDFTEYADDYDNGGQISNNFKNTDLAFSPNFIASSDISYSFFQGIEVAFLSKVVSKQYLDNTSNNGRSLAAFDVHDLRLRYNTSVKQIKNIGLSFLVNNVFSEKFASNGYSYSYIMGSKFTTENFYFPQAYRNYMVSLNLKF
ncbi:TonB-dependent receptor [Pedobacter sp. P351]|uniref:TonB-dependent receptor n=1 Tax=Pedobacter superstes TaxID=3133441 RepID=UPI0030ABEF83